jgi:hypothetical protein
MLTFALVVFGCGGPKELPAPAGPDTAPAPKDDPAPRPADTTPPKNVAPPPPPAATWTQDVQQMRFPTTQVSGRVCGRPFAPKTCELSRLRERFLVLRQGDEFNPELEVRIFLSSDRGEDFSGKTYEISPDAAPPVPLVSVLCREVERRPAQPQPFTTKYAMRLEFGQESNGQLPGKVYLCLPDEAKSCIAGTFTADLEPDYAKPPRPYETPCVVGRIALKGRNEFNVITGYIGLTAEGAPVSNLIGTPVSPGQETSVSSMTDPPQRSTLVNDASTGCLCRHARLAPGRYLFFVGTGERYIDWRWVEVRDKAPLTLNFTLEPDVAGALEVVLPKDAKGGVRLIPLDETGKVPDVKEALDLLSLAMKTDADVKDGRVLLDGLRPGHYRVTVGGATKDVAVKAKETVKADLSAP